MKIALLGATGFVGSALLDEALTRGHAVTAPVRDPAKLEPRPGLAVVRGDIYDTAALADTIRGHDAVISAFSPGWQNPSLYVDQVRGTKSIIAAVKAAGVKRVLWVGGAGGLFAGPGLKLIDSLGFPEAVKPGSRATSEALEMLRAEPQLEWTFLAPPAALEQGARTGAFRLGGDDLLVDASSQSRVSIQDYAVAMIDELERPAHTRRRFTVGY